MSKYCHWAWLCTIGKWIQNRQTKSFSRKYCSCPSYDVDGTYRSVFVCLTNIFDLKGNMAAHSPHLTWAFFLFNLQNTCNFHCKFKISKCQTNFRNKSFCIFCTFYTPRLVAKNQELNYWNNLIIFLVLAGNLSQFSSWASFSVSFFLKLHWGGGEGSHRLEMEPFSIEMVNGEEKLIITLPHYLEKNYMNWDQIKYLKISESGVQLLLLCQKIRN